MPFCRACQKTIPGDWADLARHIMNEKRGHRSGRKWAAKVLLKPDQLSKKHDDKNDNRTPLTAEEKQAKRETLMTLSGKEENVPTVCPRCKNRKSQRLPSEYVQLPNAWRTAQAGTLIVLCDGCRK